jgi:hypothetical protein
MWLHHLQQCMQLQQSHSCFHHKHHCCCCCCCCCCCQHPTAAQPLAVHLPALSLQLLLLQLHRQLPLHYLHLRLLHPLHLLVLCLGT